MNTALLALRSLRFHWRAHAGVLLGSALTTAVLTGALLVGDSVRGSLLRFADQRLGAITHAVNTGNRFFAAGLADRVAAAAGCRAAPILLLQGSAMQRGSDGRGFRQIHRVQIVGADERFWRLAPGAVVRPPADGEAAVNERVARELGASPGEEISLRIARPSLLPRDAPLSSRKDALSAFVTLKVGSVVPDTALGRFSLEAGQAAPRNVFVSLSWLQDQAGLRSRANRLLVAADQPARTTADLQGILDRVWELSDAGTVLRPFEKFGLVQLESDRVFLDPPVGRAALAVPGTPPPVGVLTYLVNSISTGSGPGQRQTPYSFVTACSPSADARLGVVPADMQDGDILVNRWLADQIAVTGGATVTLAYYELRPSGDFVENRRDFTVRGIVEMDRLAAERELMPDFPGLSDVDSCKDWDVGMPMDEDKIQDKPNEDYWNRYRQTPKALVTLRAGQDMWGNRFGSLTAVRYPADRVPSPAALSRAISPAELGLVFLPVRARARQAVKEATDFGGLFLGMSFFLIGSALILTGLLFAFGVEQRAGETGTLLALGYTPGRIRRLLLSEGALLALAGGAGGAWAGTAYCKLMLHGLLALWPDAVAHSVIAYHATASSLGAGVLAGVGVAILAMALALRGQFGRPVGELLAADFTQTAAAGPAPGRTASRLLSAGTWLALAAAAGAVAAALVTQPENPAETFFAAGALLLLAGLGFGRQALARAADRRPLSPTPGSLLPTTGLGLRNIARRMKRSMTVVALLASAAFLVFSVASMKRDIRAHADQPWSGTGGFDFFVETALPLPERPDSAGGRKRLALLSDARLHGADIVAAKVHEGDDASCFNLNRAQVPRLIGLDPRALAARRAFVPRGSAGDAPWDLLDKPLPDGAVPALAGDSNTAQWGLKRSGASDTIEYRDERGNPFRVRIVGALAMPISVFQGMVLVSDRVFTERYPSEEGFRMLLVRTPAAAKQNARAALEARLDKFGPDVAGAADRLAAFYGVESAYLAMFFALGGLGLLLGSAGMAVVVLRNTQERRAELAILNALGFRQRHVRSLLLAEHGTLLLAGLAIGAVASLLAMIPAFQSPGTDVPFELLAIALLVIAASGLLWTWLAARWATRGPLLAALRNE